MLVAFIKCMQSQVVADCGCERYVEHIMCARKLCLAIEDSGYMRISVYERVIYQLRCMRYRHGVYEVLKEGK